VPMKLPIHLTATFSDGHEDLPGYGRLPERDRKTIDEMLDRLEEEHDQPAMRSMIRVAGTSLFATPVIYAPSGAYRITWIYDDRDTPTAIIAVTIASLETSPEAVTGE
jgi:hypothetical protein